MDSRSASSPVIAFLLGKAPRPGTVIADVLRHLDDRGIQTAVHLPSGGNALPTWLGEAAVVVQRGLAPRDLAAALPLEEDGVRCCNRIAATIAVRNRFETIRTLAATGIAVPATAPAHSWDDVGRIANGAPVVVKMAQEAVGRGQGVILAATGLLPPEPPFAGPYIVQDYVPGDGLVHKIYVAGDQVQGLRKDALRAGDGVASGRPFPVDEHLAAIARGVGRALNLEIFGVDLIAGPRGPSVIDINPFPGFRGILPAALQIADHVTAIASTTMTARE